MANIWHFKLQCFIVSDNLISDASNWHDLLDTQIDFATSALFTQQKPGCADFAITTECPNPSDTWRIAQMTPVEGDTIAVTELDLRASEDTRATTATYTHPSLGDVRMSVISDSEIHTFFAAQYEQLKCANSVALGDKIPNDCAQSIDGNVNTPVLFDCQPGSDEVCAHTFKAPGAVEYTALWVYYNPQHDSVNAQYKRMTEFSVQCCTNSQWVTVLSPDSQQFDNSKSRWVMFEFDNSCTSQTWKIGDFSHGSYKRGHTYIFEVKYSQHADQLPICGVTEMQGYVQESSPCLPTPLPPRIQGWCTAHQEVQPVTSSHSGTNVQWHKDVLIPNAIASAVEAEESTTQESAGVQL